MDLRYRQMTKTVLVFKIPNLTSFMMHSNYACTYVPVFLHCMHVVCTHTHTDSKHFESSSCGMLQSPSDTLENWMVPLPGCCFQLKVKFSLFEFRPPRHASAPSPASQTVNLPQLQRDCKNISLIGGLIAFMQFTFSIVTYHDFEFNLRAKTVSPC